MNLVVFDIDGTLTHTTGVDDACYLAAFQEIFGFLPTQEGWDELPHVTDTGIAITLLERAWNRPPSPQELAALEAAFVRNLEAAARATPERFREVPGARVFWDLLLECGTATALGTGAWRDSARVKLAALGLDPAAHPLATSSEHVTRTAIVQDACARAQQHYGCTFDSVIYLGDGVWDYRTCRELDIPFIGIDVAGNGKLRALGVQHVFSGYTHPAAVLAALDSLRRG